MPFDRGYSNWRRGNDSFPFGWSLAKMAESMRATLLSLACSSPPDVDSTEVATGRDVVRLTSPTAVPLAALSMGECSQYSAQQASGVEKSSLEEKTVLNRSRGLPKSPFGLAVLDAWNRWPTSGYYLSDARFTIDNNAVEHALRHLAIGRKNWLFISDDCGLQSDAVLMSL